MIKAVIFDLDRTLLTSDKRLTEYSIKVLQKCKENGIKLCVATARPLRTVEPYLKIFPFDAVAVMNGAKVICGDNIETVEMDKKETLVLLEKLGNKNYTISLEMGDMVYSNKPIPYYETLIFENFPEIPTGEAPYKILVTLENENMVRYIEDVLPVDFYYTVSNGLLIQIANKNATKINGVKKMLKCFGVSQDEAIYFGDDNDDIEALKYCSVGVAVENAIDKAKAAADYITESNDNDGVAKYIENYILKKD